jgi:hypothetical protein
MYIDVDVFVVYTLLYILKFEKVGNLDESLAYSVVCILRTW